MRLPLRSDLHLGRRLWHFFGVLVMFVLANLFTHRQAVAFTVFGSALMISFDLARLRLPRLNRFFTWAFGPVLRESETRTIAGSTYMMAGVTILICVFPPVVARLTLLLFAVADPLASYFGIRFGREKLIGQKTLPGTLAAFVACFIVSLLFYSGMSQMHDRLFIVCMLSGLIGAGSELVPIGLDDNLVFPVLCATLLTGLFYVFGGF